MIKLLKLWKKRRNKRIRKKTYKTQVILYRYKNIIMGLFQKLFKKSANIEVTSKMMPEEQFWQLIDDSLRNTSNEEQQEKFLIDKLEKLTPTEIIWFRLRTDYLLYNTYNLKMWCAAFIMNDWCSDDWFEYFRCWLISRWKETYYNALKDPDSLINEVIDWKEYYDFESFWYIALDAFERITWKELYEYISDDFKICEWNYPDIDFNRLENNSESIKKICPKLYKKLNV